MITDTYDTTSSSPPPPATTTTPVANTPALTTTPAPVTTAPSADCAFWDELLGWYFQVYNIANWGDDLGEDNGGQGLLDNERGCGALTGVSGIPGQFFHGRGKSPFLSTLIRISWLT